MLGSDHIVQISVKVMDKATDPLKRISQQIKGMSGDLKGMGTHLSAFNSKLGQSINVIDKMANSMYKFNMYTSTLQRNMKMIGAIGLGTAAAVGVQTANRAVDFEYKTTKMQTKMGVNDNVKQQINDYILNSLTGTTSFKPTAIADLGILLGQAGVNNLPDMKDLLKSTTYFAEAVDADANTAGKMIISASNGFGISLKNSSSITNKLAVALNQSLLEVDEMPHAIGELSGRAKMLGQSLDSSLVALMTGSNQGMGAAQTSQDFLHGMRQLSMVGDQELMTPKKKQLYEKAGIDTSFFDTKKRQLKEYPEIIASLEKSMQNIGLMPNKEHFYQVIAANGGVIPDGLIDKMSMMPLISKVFGAAGQAPMLMGLQAKYDMVDKNTGEKTGKSLWGSDALKAMQADIENSSNVVKDIHDKMSETARFQLDVLSGTWEKAQIKIADDFLPLIKVATNELTKYIGGKGAAGGLNAFNNSVSTTAANLRKTNPMLADTVQLMGDITSGAIQIGGAMAPTGKQVANAAIDLTKADWGGPLWKLPYQAVTNGFSFIQDVAAGNKESDKAISQLPPELQDKAKLTRGLIQGGIVLVAAGAIIKIIELAFRAASLGLKGVKGVTTLGETLFKLLTGNGKGALDALKQTMAINANIVNVYGKAINTPGDIPGGTPGTPDNSPKPKPKIPYKAALAVTAFTIATGFEASVWEKAQPAIVDGHRAMMGNTSVNDAAMGNSISKPKSAYDIMGIKQQFPMSFNPYDVLNLNGLKPNKNGVVSGFDFLGGNGTLPKKGMPSISDFLGKNTDEITKGFNNVNKSLNNVKIENKMNLQFNPTITVTPQADGTSKATISNEQILGLQNFMNDQSKRYSQ